MKRILIISAVGAVALLVAGCATHGLPDLSRSESERFDVRIESSVSYHDNESSAQGTWPVSTITEKGKELEVFGDIRSPARIVLPVEATLADVWKAIGGVGRLWDRSIFLTTPEPSKTRRLWLKVHCSHYPRTDKEWAMLIDLLAPIAVPPGTAVFFSHSVL